MPYTQWVLNKCHQTGTNMDSLMVLRTHPLCSRGPQVLRQHTTTGEYLPRRILDLIQVGVVTKMLKAELLQYFSDSS